MRRKEIGGQKDQREIRLRNGGKKRKKAERQKKENQKKEKGKKICSFARGRENGDNVTIELWFRTEQNTMKKAI